MPDGQDAITIKLVNSIGAIPAADWDACAGIGADGAGNPFVMHAFLAALEDSGSATAETGWAPHHLTAMDATGRMIGAAPMYLKGHSYGEYVFDWGWAEAYERAGGKYYPKLQVAVPFTPATGPRLLIRADLPSDRADDVRSALIGAMERVAGSNGLSSVHITFPTEAEARALGKAGWLRRAGQQFHWENRNYGVFDDFLGALASRKRKTIRKERREVAESDVIVRPLTGAEIEPRHWDAFHRFYLATADHKWGNPYLTREFFHQIGATMADRILLVVAERDGRPVAGALNLMGDGTLYGRNWGCDGEFKFLHFEACYYQAIDFAIQRGLSRVEAGAQGTHKIQRGYLPVETHSAHWIADPGFRDAVEKFLERERLHVHAEMAGLSEYSPFRKDGGEE